MSLIPFTSRAALPPAWVLLLSCCSALACKPTNDSVASDGTGGTNGDGDLADYMPEGDPCEFGGDETKCEAASDIACTPVLAHTGRECDRDSDCEGDDLCFESTRPDTSGGECLRLFGECLPRCGGEFDCPGGQTCDMRTGQCVDSAAKNGARFGENCEAESDCAGFCVEVNDTVFECEEHCRVGAVSGCGESDLSTSDVACAFFAYSLSDFGMTQGAGDLGTCARLCNCTADCPGAQKCLAEPTRNFAGVCIGGTVDPEVTDCSPGMGGSGGT